MLQSKKKKQFSRDFSEIFLSFQAKGMLISKAGVEYKRTV